MGDSKNYRLQRLQTDKLTWMIWGIPILVNLDMVDDTI